MTWFDDLSPYRYAHYENKPNAPPVLSVGWLERGKPCPTGDVPSAFTERLALLVEHAETRVMRGMHFCDFCPQNFDELGPDPSSHPWSHSEIRAVDEAGVRFASPTLIFHYVTGHLYRPPQRFIDAVLRVADLKWEDALSSNLCLSCGSSLIKTSEYANVYKPATGEHGISADMWCDTCDTDYDRWFPYGR